MGLCLHVKPLHAIRVGELLVINRSSVGVRLFIDAPRDWQIDRVIPEPHTPGTVVHLGNEQLVRVGQVTVGNRNAKPVRLVLNHGRDWQVERLESK